MEWIDNARGGEINGAEVKIGDFRLKVHHHIDYPKDMWLASCVDLFWCWPLEEKELSSAKAEAVIILRIILEAALIEIKNNAPCYGKGSCKGKSMIEDAPSQE